MSIFKQTLAEGIQQQLQSRTNVVTGINSNQTNRNQLLPWYLSKNSWVRMTSMVNYTSGDVKFNENGKIDIEKNGNWVDDQLAQRYILEGGTLYTKKNGNDIEATLRKNVATEDGVYGGNFDVMGNGRSDQPYTRQFGIRPMPGITSVGLYTVGAYGSIFNTRVTFYAWDSKQLSDLELLFMRPGYSVLLEWGWSQYLDNNGKNQVFQGGTINPFQKQTQQQIYDKLETLRRKYNYNYDGMLGYVKNFSWKLMKGGGYECTTELISMGEVINSLKISTNNLKTSTQKPNFDFDKKVSYVYDDYENILLSLKASGEGLKGFNYLSGSLRIDENNYRGNWEYDKNYIKRTDISNKLKNNGHEGPAKRLLEAQPFVKKINIAKPEDPKAEGDYYEYISLDVLMSIMDSYFNLQIVSKDGIPSSTNEKIVKIIPPGQEDYCLAGPDSISVDPSVCLVSNPLAYQKEFVRGLNPVIQDNSELGVVPPVKKIDIINQRNTKSEQFYSLPNFYDPEKEVGKIGDIFVNISFLLNEYRSIKNSANDDGVNFITYTKSILSKISNSLGGLNNFILSSAGRDQNTLRIADTYYLDKDKQKYEFDLIGLGSICRDVSIESQIFPEQSTIVAIAAQSRANLGDVYNSTQVYLNAGLEDRVALAKQQPGEEDSSSSITMGDPNNPFYQKLFEFLIYVRNNVVGTGENFSIDTQTTGTVPYTFLKQFMLKYNGELGFKALIPFKLQIKLDGIGGIVVGEIFKVKQGILPKNYYDKNLGFIITKISHDLKSNDWETTLETQICLLDPIDAFGNKWININRKGFQEFLALAVKDSLLYPALISFMEYQAIKSFLVLLYDNINGVGQTLLQEIFTFGRNVEGERRLNPEPLPLTAAVMFIKQDLNTVYVNNDRATIQKVWNFRSRNAINLEENSTDSTAFPVRYDVDEFAGYFQKWVAEYKEVNADLLELRLTEDKTLGQTLDEITSEPYYSETLLPISNKIKENSEVENNMFTNLNNMWGNVFGNVNYNIGTKNAINYTQLRQNIENTLVSREIVTNTVRQAYHLLPFLNGELQAEVNPIDNKINGILYPQINFISNPFTNAAGTTDIGTYFPQDQKSFIKSWYGSMSGVEVRQKGIEQVLESNIFE